jgi:hypothetical protein
VEPESIGVVTKLYTEGGKERCVVNFPEQDNWRGICAEMCVLEGSDGAAAAAPAAQVAEAQVNAEAAPAAQPKAQVAVAQHALTAQVAQLARRPSEDEAASVSMSSGAGRLEEHDIMISYLVPETGKGGDNYVFSL